MRNMRKIRPWGAAAIAGALATASCQPTPEQDLEKLGAAIKRGDSAEAVRYLDVDRTTAAFVNEFMDLALKQADTAGKSDRASGLGKEMGEAMVRMMQPVMETMIRQGVYDLVSGRPIRTPGSLSGGQADTVSRDSILQLSPRILKSSRSGDTAMVSVEIHPRDRVDPTTLQVRMEHPEKVWRVVRVEGLGSAIMDSAGRRRR